MAVKDNYDAGVPLGEDTRPKDAIKRGLSSACVEEEWDCTKKGMNKLELLYDKLNIMMEEFPVFDKESLGLELYTAASAERRDLIKKINALEND